MSKETKKAEMALIDSDKFPAESFRERLSRKFGLDAVALSGPCEGQCLVDCVVDQMEKRWNKIRDRFAGNQNRAFKLAIKLAESYRMKDDTQKCIGDLEKIGYKTAAASGIASYLKAYAMGPAADMEMEQAMGTIMADHDPMENDAAPSPAVDAPPGDDLTPEAPMGDMGSEPEAALPPPEPAGMDAGVAPAADMGMDTVTIDLPIEVAEQLKNAIEQNTMDTPGAEMGSELGLAGEPEGIDIEVIDMTPGGDLHGDVEDVSPEAPSESSDPMGSKPDDFVPGEPSDESDDHKVEGEEASSGGQKCKACGHSVASTGKPAEPKPAPHAAEQAENKEFGEEVYKAASMRAGHLRPNGTKRVASEGVAKLGNEMKLNNTDQIGPHEGKELGSAKEKSPDEPKPISEGNLETEGHSAGDKKFQDKSTMGSETAFDAKEFDKGSSTGGKSSLMGKDESFPEGKPKVPAGSSPIGGEQFQGGDLSTKGTVIAKIKPDGVYVEGGGKQFRAKGDIKMAMVEKIQAGLSKIAESFNGDAKAFALAASKVIKEAEESGKVDNVTKTDTAKLEGSKFTNDADKKPDEGGAVGGAGKGSKSKEDGVTKTDTSKKEDSDFTNDGEKKPEKEAAAAKDTKVAKAVEEPKPLEDGNVKAEGHTAGGDKLSKEKPDFKTVDKSEVGKGAASEMGKDEEFPKGKPEVPAGGGKMGNEEFDGGNVSTKGTTIAETSQKRSVSASEETLQGKLNEAAIREARYKVAGVYVADLMAHGDITADQYAPELEKAAQLPVQAINSLIAHTKQMRTRLANNAGDAQRQDGKTAGLSIPVVRTSSTETSLVDQLVKQFKLTQDLDKYENMK